MVHAYDGIAVIKIMAWNYFNDSEKVHNITLTKK